MTQAEIDAEHIEAWSWLMSWGATLATMPTSQYQLTKQEVAELMKVIDAGADALAMRLEMAGLTLPGFPDNANADAS